MFVYAKDRDRGNDICCITLEECKESPWRWEFVKMAPGQEDVEEVVTETYEVPKVKPKATRRVSK